MMALMRSSETKGEHRAEQQQTTPAVGRSAAGQMRPEGGPSTASGGDACRPSPPLQGTCDELTPSACAGGYTIQPAMSVGGDGQACEDVELQQYVSGAGPGGSAALKGDPHDPNLQGASSGNRSHGETSQVRRRNRSGEVCC